MSGDVTFARETGDRIDIISRKILRTRLLRHLNRVYPKRIARSVLVATLCEGHGGSFREVDGEVEYLIEKQMITSKREARLRISPRGRDFLDGHIDEVGLADPAVVD
jgi:hypothetical protein